MIEMLSQFFRHLITVTDVETRYVDEIISYKITARFFIRAVNNVERKTCSKNIKLFFLGGYHGVGRLAALFVPSI